MKKATRKPAKRKSPHEHRMEMQRRATARLSEIVDRRRAELDAANAKEPEPPRPMTFGTAWQPVDDPWAHRSTRMRCASCMWFLLKRGTLGRCRRRAPELAGWPAVFTTDWCGDHKLDETKV